MLPEHLMWVVRRVFQEQHDICGGASLNHRVVGGDSDHLVLLHPPEKRQLEEPNPAEDDGA